MLDEVGNRLSGLSLSGGGEFKGRGVPSRKGESKRRGSPKGGGRGWKFKGGGVARGGGSKN